MSPRIKRHFSLNGTLHHLLLKGILRLILGLYIMAYQTELTQAETALGNSNPTLAYNLDHYKDWAPVMQFLDIAKSMRPWVGVKDKWGDATYDELKEGGHLDENGWVTEIPESLNFITTLWQWSNRSDLGLAEDVRGIYVLEYEGTGEIVMKGDARILSSEPGKIVFENMNGENLYLQLHSTDPEGTGDYVRNISIVAEKNLPLYETGAVYNPAWLELIEDARELRFMGWGETNGATISSWSERSSPEGLFWGAGVPVEYMVKLANEVGADPWFTMPHTADADYIRNFAIYVRDNLDPELTAKVEYSNEAWNWAFDQTDWLHAKAEEEWGVEGGHNDYYVKKSVETALIWEEVFGEEADARLVNVLGAHINDPWLTGRLLEAKVWKENEPDSYVAPSSIFEELAVTTYFGNFTVSDETLRSELIAAIQDPDVDATAYLAEKLMDPDYRGSIPQIADVLAQNAALAEEYGLKLSAYEGGQHVHHSFAINGLTNEDISALQDFMIDFVRSEEMGQLYRELWDVWAEHGDGPFMQHGDVGTPNKWGSWSLYAGLEDTTPRSEAIEELNSATVPWWTDDVDTTTYQQGVISDGTEAADMLVGTGKTDYLLGMDGDDILVGGEGNDGLNGGGGVDRAVFSGAFDDYIIRAEGDGYRVDGPDGSDFLINVEELAFENNQVVTLSELVDGGDGTLILSLLNELQPIINEDDEIVGGPIKSGLGYEYVDINTLIGPNDGLVIKTIWSTSKVAKAMELDPSNAAPSYIAYSQGTHEFSDLVQTLEASLTGTEQTNLGVYNAAIVTQATKLVLTDGNDSFFGGNLSDSVLGGHGNDTMLGGLGDDMLYGNEGNDHLIGHAGNDKLYGNGGNDHIDAGKGRDTIDAGSGNDKIYAGEDDDIIFGRSGSDFISGGHGNDTLFGENGDDTLFGNEGDDRISAGAGNDKIFGGAGNDHIDGNFGNNEIYGGAGNDKIYAGRDNDILYGEGDDDILHGQAGNDQLFGGFGHDVLVGGLGDDILIGGDGKDRFAFAFGDGDDRISDFTSEDTLDLKAFFSEGQTLEDASSMEDGHLVLSNGEDRVVLLGLDTEDLSWMSIDI